MPGAGLWMAPVNVLITGGLGFQGRHLTASLVGRGHTVTIVATPSVRSREAAWDGSTTPGSSRPGARIVWGSVLNSQVIQAAVEEQDVIVHMAAMTNPEACWERPYDAFAVNVGGTQTILEALRETPCRLVHVSSCEVYGAPDLLDPSQDEASPMRPSTVYAASKCAADRLVYAYTQSYDVRATIVRPCNIYGPGQRAGAHGGVIPTMVTRALLKLSLQVRGRGEQRREYMHVTDVTDVYTRLVERDVSVPGGVINVGSGQGVAVIDIARAIQRALGARIDYVTARPGEVREFRLDSSQARRHGLLPSACVPFDRGLDDYIMWARTSS